MIRGITAIVNKTKIGEALVNVPKTLIRPQPPVPNTANPAPKTISNSNAPVPNINPVEFNKNLRAWEKEGLYKKLCEKKEHERKFEMSQFMDWS